MPDCPAAEAAGPAEVRRWRRRYALLTAAVFLPLTWAFLTLNNWYPVPVWSLFSEHGRLDEEFEWYVLRGETAAGETIDLPPITITDGLTGRIHTMVHYVASNQSYQLASPHPSNVADMVKAGGADRLPPGARMPFLLRSWGDSYNSRLSADSPRRLRAVQLDAYVWPGGRYADYDHHVRAWRVEL
jgi:hypothetical protein